MEWRKTHGAVVWLVWIKAGMDQHADEGSREEGTVETCDIVEETEASLITKGDDLRKVIEDAGGEFKRCVGSNKEIDHP